MEIMDRILSSMKMIPDDENLDSELEDEEDVEEETAGSFFRNSEPKEKKSLFKRLKVEETEVEIPDESATVVKKQAVRSARVMAVKTGGSKQSEVRMIIPKSYEDSNEIADFLIDGKTVVLNLEEMNVELGQRIIDFTVGACYTMGGNLQKISKKIFIATPSTVELSGDFTDLLSETIDLSSLNLG